MATHVMVDLETFGTAHDAAIVSLGAVKFEPNTFEILDKFYVVIDPKSCQDFKLSMDADTVLWWLHEDRAEARKTFFDTASIDLASALEGFAIWFGESKPVWGNGATFDNVILRSAYKAVGIAPPWEFWQDRCYRTVKNLAPDLEVVRSGTYHNALDDAITQARHLQAIVDALGLRV